MTVEDFVRNLRTHLEAKLRQYGPGCPLSLSGLSDLLELATSGKQPPTAEQLEYGLPGKKMERRTPHRGGPDGQPSYMDLVSPKEDIEIRHVRSREEEIAAQGEGFQIPAKNPYFR